MSSISLQQLLPNLQSSLDGTGFIFGARTSREAGYPMMVGLTRSVISALLAGERATLDEALAVSDITYDEHSASPNIEQIADVVIAHLINSGEKRFSELEQRLRALILECILSIENPDLSCHVKFFEALKRRAFGLSCSVWIFTTNYDILFETAASEAGVVVENGFCGSITRFFNPSIFHNTHGVMGANRRFIPSSTLTVRLVKLHGSISWLGRGSALMECHPAAIPSAEPRAMILPRRRKVIETLAAPYDALFALASRVIGQQCKYIASCGFSFGDDHINQTLIVPNLAAARCRLFVLCQEETPTLESLRSYQISRAHMRAIE